MQYIVTFYTQNGAFKFQRFLKDKGIDVKLMPTPRVLSSSCGISAAFEYEEDITGFIIEEVDAIYKRNNNQYNLVYRD
jgi:hypothetical protein